MSGYSSRSYLQISIPLVGQDSWFGREAKDTDSSVVVEKEPSIKDRSL